MKNQSVPNSQPEMDEMLRKEWILLREPQHIHATQAAVASSPALIIEYFDLLSDKISGLNPTENLHCVWNFDDKGWSKQQALQQSVLVTRGKPQMNHVFDFTQNTSIILCMDSFN